MGQYNPTFQFGSNTTTTQILTEPTRIGILQQNGFKGTTGNLEGSDLIKADEVNYAIINLLNEIKALGNLHNTNDTLLTTVNLSVNNLKSWQTSHTTQYNTLNTSVSNNTSAINTLNSWKTGHTNQYNTLNTYAAKKNTSNVFLTYQEFNSSARFKNYLYFQNSVNDSTTMYLTALTGGGVKLGKVSPGGFTIFNFDTTGALTSGTLKTYIDNKINTAVQNVAKTTTENTFTQPQIFNEVTRFNQKSYINNDLNFSHNNLATSYINALSGVGLRIGAINAAKPTFAFDGSGSLIDSFLKDYIINYVTNVSNTLNNQKQDKLTATNNKVFNGQIFDSGVGTISSGQNHTFTFTNNITISDYSNCFVEVLIGSSNPTDSWGASYQTFAVMWDIGKKEVRPIKSIAADGRNGSSYSLIMTYHGGSLTFWHNVNTFDIISRVRIYRTAVTSV